MCMDRSTSLLLPVTRPRGLSPGGPSQSHQPGRSSALHSPKQPDRLQARNKLVFHTVERMSHIRHPTVLPKSCSSTRMRWVGGSVLRVDPENLGCNSCLWASSPWSEPTRAACAWVAPCAWVLQGSQLPPNHGLGSPKPKTHMPGSSSSPNPQGLLNPLVEVPQLPNPTSQSVPILGLSLQGAPAQALGVLRVHIPRVRAVPAAQRGLDMG